ncbi:MAG: xanthine dehydrogenase family protein subunit M [Actinobacteria bacterium]|nr:MAG: xanthine dehydrogenase family protein subunit M [Actinomycetota bacterium]
MKPAPFEYHAPTTVDEATAVLAEHGEEAKPLAGGQSLVPLLALRLTRFAHLIDLNDVASLSSMSRQGDEFIVGAMVRQDHVEHEAEIATGVPLLARATPLIGHFQIRSRGTVGGSLAHADPASEYPAVALALDAVFDIKRKNGARSVAARDFFLGTWTTCLEADELLVAIRFPVADSRRGFSIEEAARRHGDFAMVGCACALGVDSSGAIDRASLAMFGVGATPMRAGAAERALLGQRDGDFRPEGLVEIGQLAVRDLDPPSDVHATSAYRRSAGAVLVGRAVANAVTEATRG